MVIPHGVMREEQRAFDEKLHHELVRVHAVFSRYRGRTVFWDIEATADEVEWTRGFQGVR